MRRIACLSALALLSVLAAACSGKEEAEQTPEAGPGVEARLVNGNISLSADQMERIGVRFAAAETVTEIPVATVPATIAPPPNARVAVVAILPGVVTRTSAVEGDAVKAGQELAVIASREMFTLGASIERAGARAQAARAHDERMSQLAEEGVIAGARADEARAALLEAEAELAEHRRVLALVGGSTAAGTYTLTAPIDGVVALASAHTGNPVDASGAAYVIDAVSKYELMAQIPERLVGQVRTGMVARLEDGVLGEVTSVGTSLDAQTRSALLRASIPEAPGIVSGRATVVTLLTPAEPGTVIVPAAAVVDVGGVQTSFVRSQNGVTLREVQARGGADGKVVILSGLNAGDDVVISGTSELKSIAQQD